MLRFRPVHINFSLRSIQRFLTSNAVAVEESRVMKLTDYTQYSKIMGESLYPKLLAPSKNFRADWAHDMPPAIDPENWKLVTPDDLRAHQERQAIRGRLRREFWAKKYHPTDWQHFNPINSDPMFTKFHRVRSIYFTMDNPQASPREIFVLVSTFVILLAAYLTYVEMNIKNLEKNVHALHPSINFKA